MASREPDFIVGEASDPYLKRWWVIPRNPLFNIYLHDFCRSDDDVLHDHPGAYASWILRSGYWEDRFISQRHQQRGLFRTFKPEGAVIWRRAATAHRVVVQHEAIYASCTPHPITLFFGGPKLRTWGFHCPQGWIPWQQYIASTSYGNRRGRGCN